MLAVFTVPLVLKKSVLAATLVRSISIWSLPCSKPLIDTLLASFAIEMVSLIALKFLVPVSRFTLPDFTFSTLTATSLPSAFVNLVRSTVLAPLASRTRLVPLSSSFWPLTAVA